jgi:hypothetical protein
MPALLPEIIGECPKCGIQIALNSDKTVPWHCVPAIHLVEKCDGTGLPGRMEPQDRSKARKGGKW